jgi:hypothetical protein
MMGGYNACTGHPVMIVVVVVMEIVITQAAIFVSEEQILEMCLLASIFKSHRNNEMIRWFAKYFL